MWEYRRIRQFERQLKLRYTHPGPPFKASAVFTETPGEYCIYPPSYKKELTFVTLEDVFDGQFELNMVIYNPMLSKEKNEQLLKKGHNMLFKHRPIPDDVLDELTTYDKMHLNEFIDAYKKFALGKD